MTQIIITGVFAVIVTVVGAVANYFLGRNSRSLANQEADLLKKLPAGDRSIPLLEEMINDRVWGWYTTYQLRSSKNGVVLACVGLALGVLGLGVGGEFPTPTLRKVRLISEATLVVGGVGCLIVSALVTVISSYDTWQARKSKKEAAHASASEKVLRLDAEAPPKHKDEHEV